MREKPKNARICRSLTLLEIVIGFALTGILLSFLFSNFRHITGLDCKIEKVRRAVHSRSIVQLRLSQVFERLIAGKEEVNFYIESHPMSGHDALYFTIDNGIDRDQRFCGVLQGSLYVDQKKRLCLSLITKTAERKEILLTSITSLLFECFNSKEKRWDSKWEEKNCPKMLKMRLNKDLVFAFILQEIT